MGVDFVLHCKCPVKDQLSTAGLIELVKSRGRAAALLEMARSEGNTKPPSEILVTQFVETPQGIREKWDTSVQSMLDAAAPLDHLGHHCARCAANVVLEPFSCYGSIRYPIQLRTEQWLMSLLPTELNSTAGLILQKYVKDFGYDGGAILDLRENPTFFEDPTGARRTWKSKGRQGRDSTAFSLTSSQILQMMFCVGDLNPSHCSFLCLFLGLIPHDIAPDQLTENKTYERIASPDYDVPGDLPDADGFVHFAHVLLRSAWLDMPVMIDY